MVKIVRSSLPLSFFFAMVFVCQNNFLKLMPHVVVLSVVTVGLSWAVLERYDSTRIFVLHHF